MEMTFPPHPLSGNHQDANHHLCQTQLQETSRFSSHDSAQAGACLYTHKHPPCSWACLPKETSLKIPSCGCNVSCASAPCQHALEHFLISHFRGLSQKKTWYFSCDLFLASLYFYHCVFILFSVSEQSQDCSVGLDILHSTSLLKVLYKTWILIIVRTVRFIFNLQCSSLYMQLRQKSTKGNLAVNWHSLDMPARMHCH